MSRSASRRPADERISPSDCTDQVTTPPVAVSRVKLASCPQLLNTALSITISRHTLPRAMKFKCCSVTCGLPTRPAPFYGAFVQKVPSGRVSYPAPNDWKSAISRPSVAQICTPVSYTHLTLPTSDL